MQVKLVWRHFKREIRCYKICKYDRNTIVNILKKQGVPWVFIHLLYHSSHILRTTKKYGDNFNLRVSLYTSTQNSFLVAEVFYWNKQNRMKLTPSVSNNTWTWWKRHQFKLMRQSPHIFLNVNELVRPKAK